MQNPTYQGVIAYSLLLLICGIMIGMAIERWRTSPLRRIKQKYRAERRAAMRN